MSRTIQNHYVPQHYLKGFCNEKGLIFLYEKGNDKVTGPTPVRKVGYREGFYSASLEVELNQQVEIPAHTLLNRLRAEIMIEDKDKHALARYMVSLIKRVPKGLQRLQRLSPQILDETVKKTKEDYENIIKDDPRKRAEFERQWAELAPELEQWKQTPPPHVWDNLLHPEETPKAVQALRSLVWNFYISEKPVFLTSDNPVYFPENMGIGKAETEVSFPISSYILLRATNLLSLMRFYPTTHEIIDRANQHTVLSATRHVFHCENAQWVLALMNTQS